MSRNRFFVPRVDNKLGNRYELLECLGDGSYGWVWRAQRLRDNAVVAVKIPKEQGAKNEDLAEGATLIGQARHPNIVNVYWMGRVPPEREWYAIEMEYFPSVTLAQLMDREEHGYVSSYRTVMNVFCQVLNGVEYLHSLGMSHGDIKPQNILVSGEQVKLTDFGCSTISEDIYCRTRENGGTILYSAPEIAGLGFSSHTDPFRVDIYSLGVLLYHFVTGRLPHDTPSQVVRHVPFPRPREVNQTICPALEDYILRCLAHLPDDRWISVSAMLASFQAVKRSQLDYNALTAIPQHVNKTEDWSSLVVRFIEDGACARAESIAVAEFESTHDPHAFLLALRASSNDGRYFDCLKLLDTHNEMLSVQGPTGREIRRLALDASIETRRIHHAGRLVDQCLLEDGENPRLMLRKASILGLQARYDEASKILLDLNRMHPRTPSILKRLALVFEQIRDTGKAVAFLRAYLDEVPDDEWATEKLTRFSTIGLA